MLVFKSGGLLYSVYSHILTGLYLGGRAKMFWQLHALAAGQCNPTEQCPMQQGCADAMHSRLPSGNRICAAGCSGPVTPAQ